MYNPEVIFLNNSVYRKNPELIVQLKKQLKSFLLTDIQLKSGTFNDLATLYGGIALTAMNFLNIKELSMKHPF